MALARDQMYQPGAALVAAAAVVAAALAAVAVLSVFAVFRLCHSINRSL